MPRTRKAATLGRIAARVSERTGPRISKKTLWWLFFRQRFRPQLPHGCEPIKVSLELPVVVRQQQNVWVCREPEKVVEILVAWYEKGGGRDAAGT